MDNIIDIELTGRSTRRDQKLWQYDYGQMLRITGKEFPKVTEVQFSLQRSGGHTLDRIGTFDNGVLSVQIPNELLQNKGATSDYTIYAFVYLSGDESGNTKYMIQLPVESRPEPTDPSEDPTIDPSIFKDAVNAVNASADRAETAEKSARESAAKAKGYAESAGKSKEYVEKERDNAISAIGIAKESALSDIASKTDESVLKIQSQTEDSQNGIKQSIADATEKKTELDGAISNATDAKGNLDKAVQSAGNAKSELDASVGKAGEAKAELDSSISSAGEKKLALDATVAQANTADASLKEQIGSAEQIQANVEQIRKNTQAISSLNKDLAEVQDKKITKFYASNQGEMHLADSDNGKMQDMILYGRSEQKIYSGYQLIDTSNPVDGKQKTTNGITFTVQDDGGIKIVGTSTDDAYFNFNLPKNKLKLKDNCSLIVSANELYSKRNINFQNDIYVDDAYAITLQQPGSGNIAKTFSGSVAIGNSRIVVPRKTTVDVIYYPMIEYGNTTHDFEPYTGGIPSPNPDYPQEIKSVVNPVVKVSNGDGTESQTIQLPYTLNAIPVASGGNVTIDGQQYIADYVDVERWKLVRMVDTSKLDSTQSIVDKTEWLLAEPQEIALTTEEITAFKELATYYPTTNISVNSDQLDGYTVFNYPISMANGWNYVKQQLGDTREYIYDMDAKAQDIDIQSAEAYVNSEYAVALTELEV